MHLWICGQKTSEAKSSWFKSLRVHFHCKAIFIQRENPALPVRDECSDTVSEPRTEQGVNESKLSFAHQNSSISEDGSESRQPR